MTASVEVRPSSGTAVEPGPPPAARRRLLGVPVSPHWPLTALLVGFPVWWVLGLSDFVFPILAVPMVWHLRRRPAPVRLPPGFALWGLFLVWVVLSLSTLGLHAPDTLAGSTKLRLFGYSLRLVEYLSQTVVLLYVGNLDERELPRATVVRQLGIFFLYAVAGGIAGLLAPRFEFSSLAQAVLPHSLAVNPAVAIYTHPALSQVQSVLGHVAPRPEAPFDYTNVWGGNISVLAIFFVLTWGVWGRRRRRLLVAPVLLVALIPFIYSLNRTAWLGAGLMVVYAAWRLALRGRFAAFGGILVAAAVGGVILTITPLHGIISERLAHPQSNTIRASLSSDAFHDALHSPVLGYGSTRAVLGSNASIAIGRSASCQHCGNATVGSNGGFWLTLFAQGFVGVGLYVAFFVLTLLRHIRDRTPLGVACTGVVGMSLLFNFFYPGPGSALTIFMIAIALLWRNEQARQAGLPDPAGPAPRATT